MIPVLLDHKDHLELQDMLVLPDLQGHRDQLGHLESALRETRVRQEIEGSLDYPAHQGSQDIPG